MCLYALSDHGVLSYISYTSKRSPSYPQGITKACAICSMPSLALYLCSHHTHQLPTIPTSTTTFSLSHSITRDQSSFQYCTISSITITCLLTVPFFYKLIINISTCPTQVILYRLTYTTSPPQRRVLVMNLDHTPWLSHDHVNSLLSSHWCVDVLFHQS